MLSMAKSIIRAPPSPATPRRPRAHNIAYDPEGAKRPIQDAHPGWADEDPSPSWSATTPTYARMG